MVVRVCLLSLKRKTNRSDGGSVSIAKIDLEELIVLGGETFAVVVVDDAE